MTVTLGFQPLEIQVALAWGGEFVQTLTADDPWPDGVAISLQFSATEDDVPVVWAATLTTNTATWDHSVADVLAVINSGKRVARLHYTDESGNDLVWGKGTVLVV